MGLRGSKPIPALHNHGASADNKSLENPKQHLLERDSARRDWWETHSHNYRCN